MIASLVFIGSLVKTTEFAVLIPFIGFVALGYIAIKMVERGHPKALVASVLVVIVAYVWLKKYTFLPERFLIRVPILRWVFRIYFSAY